MGHWFNSCQRTCSLWMYITHVGSCCTLLSVTIGGNDICILLACLVYLNAFIPHFQWLPLSFAVVISDWLSFICFLCTSPDFIDGLAVLFQNWKSLLVWVSLPISSYSYHLFLCLLSSTVPVLKHRVKERGGATTAYSAGSCMLEFVLWHNNVLVFILSLISCNIAFAYWISAEHWADVSRELSTVSPRVLPWAIANLDYYHVCIVIVIFFLFPFLCTYWCWISSAILPTSYSVLWDSPAAFFTYSCSE